MKMTDIYQSEINHLIHSQLNDYKNYKYESVVSIVTLVLEKMNTLLGFQLPSFIIRGETPYFNDGEDCVHKSKCAIPHIVYNKDSKTKRVFDDLLEYSSMYKTLFPNSPHDDAWDYIYDIEDGNAESIIVYNNDEEKEIIYNTIHYIDHMLEEMYKTNYILHARLENNGKYTIQIQDHEPDY